MKAEEIAQWVIDNRYPKSEQEKVSDFEMYHFIITSINSVELETNCSTCKYQEVSKYVVPCYGCNDFSNFERK